MNEPFVARNLALAALVGASTMLSTTVNAQPHVEDSVCPDNAPVTFHACALEAAQSFEPPRTPIGRPDFNGIWILPNGQAGGAYEDLEAHPRSRDNLGGPATVVDPQSNRVPIQAWAAALLPENTQRYFHHNAACMLAGVPNTMYHGGPRQFLQTPDHLAMLTYNSHGYRIIPLDDHAPLGEEVKLWNGASSGTWDGDTLVIETTNQNGLPWLDQFGRFYTEEIHVVERLTLIDANTLHYEATIEDPNVYTRPFTIVLPYRRAADENYELQELACYENNEALMSISRMSGFSVYPGMTPAEARAAAEAAQ
ncbi:MAG: hypothetical protein GWN29_09250 [Gammaproteobacteria bacterium]|nr:hypothetical protein [Gammaproteobacteria bacterium]